jgi:hypothetical protein
MRFFPWFACACLSMIAVGLAAQGSDDVLPSIPIPFTPFVITGTDLVNFDILDVRAENAKHISNQDENSAHSLWTPKQQWDVGWLGVNGSTLHGTILGTHMTVAEWGRWNFGTPGVGLGFIRHSVYDPGTKRALPREDLTCIINVSVSYRLRYVRTLSRYAYLSFANTYDLRYNFPSSQFGLSFSRN